jgi:hypothetical protein
LWKIISKKLLTHIFLKPKLAADVKVIDGYDIVFVGYPNWWEVFQPGLYISGRI